MISLTDPEHVERYGLQQLADARNVELEFDIGDASEAEATAGGRTRAGRVSEISFEDEMAAEVA
jgi:hypothetical protein